MKKSAENELFWEAFEDTSDRATAITIACVSDDLLGRIIAASYLKDRRVKSLFKNDHILQSFFAKINIAYFSGLIPEFIYHDLKLICEIRNKFAHGVTTDLSFVHPSIVEQINKLKLGYEPLPEVHTPRIRFSLAVTRLVTMLQVIEEFLLKSRPPHLMEVIPLNEFPLDKDRLSQTAVRRLMRKRRR